VVGGGLCGGFGAGRAGGVWGLLLGGEAGVRRFRVLAWLRCGRGVGWLP
jgi:hypothetical protein